jgi:transposase
MARYKEYSYEQTKLIPISYNKQVQEGSFEYALSTIIDDMDLSMFEMRFRNDQTGAPAYDPAILLKIILFAYSRGIISSREIAQACTENVIFMALSADTQPHFTTIANFVSSMGEEIMPLFRMVLMVCWQEGLIAKHMFAVDGCKISSNCSKEWSGTREGFEKKKGKLEKQIKFLLGKHKMSDERQLDSKMKQKEQKAIVNLREKVKKISEWLDNNDDKRGTSGGIKQSNLTDNESAKMPSSHGVIQGYNGVAMSDAAHQVVVAAEAFGEGQEHGLLAPMIEATRQNFVAIGEKKNVFEEAMLLADSGYHSEKNMQTVFEQGIDAYIADNKFRKRDPAFAAAEEHKRPIDRNKTLRTKRWFTPSDFVLDETTGKLMCPAGNELYVKNSKYQCDNGRLSGVQYAGWKTKCRACEIRSQCLRKDTTEARQVVIFKEHQAARGVYTKRMIEKFDTAQGRFFYSRRMGIIEPVFGHIRDKLRLDHFTLRGKQKVNIQWNLYCMVHNIGKLFRYAPRYAC